MNTTFTSAALTAAIAMAPAAHAGNAFRDYANVINVEPIVRVVDVSTPHEECWEEEVRYPGRSAGHGHGHGSAGSIIIGGLIGGVIGHQFGKGRGRDVATAAGAMIGASVGHDNSAYHDDDDYEEVGYERRCRTTHERRTEERVDGYRVTYDYQGEVFTTRMSRDPGRRIPVRVSVRPVTH